MARGDQGDEPGVRGAGGGGGNCSDDPGKR